MIPFSAICSSGGRWGCFFGRCRSGTVQAGVMRHAPAPGSPSDASHQQHESKHARRALTGEGGASVVKNPPGDSESEQAACSLPGHTSGWAQHAPVLWCMFLQNLLSEMTVSRAKNVYRSNSTCCIHLHTCPSPPAHLTPAFLLHFLLTIH